MTNEQLAMLLQGYITRLDRIINGLVQNLEGVEVERGTQLQFEVNSEVPAESRGGFVFFRGCTVSATEVRSGDPVILQPLKELKEEMEEAVGVLLSCEKD